MPYRKRWRPLDSLRRRLRRSQRDSLSPLTGQATSTANLSVATDTQPGGEERGPFSNAGYQPNVGPRSHTEGMSREQFSGFLLNDYGIRDDTTTVAEARAAADHNN